MSYNTSCMWCQMSHDHNWANGSSLSLSAGLWMIISMFECSVLGRSVWQKSVIFQNLGRCPQQALVHFLSLQSTYGQSFAFPDNRKFGNALLYSRSGCLQIETLSSAAFLPVTLNTVYNKSLSVLYCSQHLWKCIKSTPRRKRFHWANR